MNIYSAYVYLSFVTSVSILCEVIVLQIFQIRIFSVWNIIIYILTLLSLFINLSIYSFIESHIIYYRLLNIILCLSSIYRCSYYPSKHGSLFLLIYTSRVNYLSSCSYTYIHW